MRAMGSSFGGGPRGEGLLTRSSQATPGLFQGWRGRALAVPGGEGASALETAKAARGGAGCGHGEGDDGGGAAGHLRAPRQSCLAGERARGSMGTLLGLR